MRNMSFHLTTAQFLDGSKDVTRRLGWANLKPGDHFMAVEKAQGLKKGEKIRKLGEIIILLNTPEPLNDIVKYPYRRLTIEESSFPIVEMWEEGTPIPAGVRPENEREGFPDLTPEQFVEMFCREMSTKKLPVTPETVINRIEFVRVRE